MEIAIQTTEIASEYLLSPGVPNFKPHNLKHTYDLKRGCEDEYGRPVKEIYAHMPGKYVVYVTDDDMIHTLAEHEELLNKRVDINEERARIRDYKENSESLRPKYQNPYAKAMVAILTNRPEVGIALLKRIREDIEKFLKRESAFWYSLGAAAATALVLVPYLFFYWYKDRFHDFSNLEVGVFYAMAFACMGGFLSVAAGTDKIRVDLLYGRPTKFVYGMFRVAIAVVSGVLIFYILRAGLGGDVLNDTQFKSLYGIYVLCAAAGFLEKLVPNAMLRVTGEKASDENSSEKLDAANKVIEELRGKVESLEKKTKSLDRLPANGQVDASAQDESSRTVEQKQKEPLVEAATA